MNTKGTSNPSPPGYLSVASDCNKYYVDRFGSNDNSGRQIWTFEKITGSPDLYRIKITKGRDNCSRNMLSVSSSCDNNDLTLVAKDTDSGREIFQITPVSGQSGRPKIFTISVGSHLSRKCERNMISTQASTPVVDLWKSDDGSGR